MDVVIIDVSDNIKDTVDDFIGHVFELATNPFEQRVRAFKRQTEFGIQAIVGVGV